MTQIEINDRFQEAIDQLEKSDRSIFITGRAGTGKSTLLDHFRNTTKKKLVVLAPTGVAAVNIRGETIHSFFRFQPGVTPQEAEKLGRDARDGALYRELDLIVIDEISMVRADLLDCVDMFLRAARKRRDPFGGARMAFIGDLYQLPPVVTGEERDVFKTVYRTPYFFDAKVMEELCPDEGEIRMTFVELEKIYRQRDADFIDLLNAIRNRTVTDEQLVKLNERFMESGGDYSGYIFLTATNAQADELNRRNLEQLPSKPKEFDGVVEGEFDRKHLPTEPVLSLKKGARVMFINNDSFGRWVNGTLGTVTALSDGEIKVQIDGGIEEQVDPVTWNLFHSYYNKESESIEKQELGRFTQFPLRMAWAITIHKSQGKTFDRVVIDLGKGAFSHGQVYVALSRCRSFGGLVLKTPVQRRHILMDYQVIRFLTEFQYRLSEKRMPLEQKAGRIREAIERQEKLRITYLKSKDEKSQREILPIRLEEMEYQGSRFLGVEAYCFARKGNRNFRVDRILEIAEV